MRKLYYQGLLFLVILALLSGCQFTQPPFMRTASDAGATFAAASTTLTYLHEGKITRQYAQSSFAAFKTSVDGLDQQLPGQQGAPSKQDVQQLLSTYKPAMDALDHPCFEGTCDWHAQEQALTTASKAFLAVSGS